MGIENGKTQGRRMVHMEVMRIIAVYFVIFNHTTDNGFTLFYNRPWGGVCNSGCIFLFLYFASLRYLCFWQYQVH